MPKTSKHHVTRNSSYGTEPATLLPLGLAPVHTTIDLFWTYLYFRFVAERHRMYERRQEGIPRNELSQDEAMTKTYLGNVYRQLDPGSISLRDQVIMVGDMSNQEVCFRIFLFSAFYKHTTWQALIDGLGETPSWKHFDIARYEAILYERSVMQKKPIYISEFQLVPPTKYFGSPHYAASLRFVQSMMEMGLPAKLLECKYAVDASAVLRTVPTLGGFLSLCLICNLNQSPHLNFQHREHATCGPGSRSYLRRIFGETVINSPAMEDAGLRWLCDNQWRFWGRLREAPPHAWQIGLQPGLTPLSCENSLCWTHCYVASFAKYGYKNLSTLPPPTFDPSCDEASYPAWCDEEKWASGSTRRSYAGEDDRPPTQGDEVYEVEKIADRLGSRSDRDGLFRVRWKGYPPEDDTWERASSLRNGAEEALQEWLDWEDTVWSTVARVGKGRVGVGVKTRSRTADTEEGSVMSRSTKRRRKSVKKEEIAVKVELKVELKLETKEEDIEVDDLASLTASDLAARVVAQLEEAIAL